MKELDLRGLACPQPVMLTRKTLLEGERELRVLVDDQVAVDNVTRMARSLGAEVKTTTREDESLLEIALPADATLDKREQGVAFFLSSETIGREEPDLGRTLMKMFLNALADFVEGIEKGTPAQPNFRSGLQTQRVCDAVIESARRGEWVDTGA